MPTPRFRGRPALRAAALLIAVLAAVSGCSGPLVGGAPDRDREAFGVPGTEDPAAGRDPASGGTGGASSASTEFRVAVSNHTEALRAAGRFVLRERVVWTVGGDATVAANRTVAVDLDAGRYWFGATGESPYDRGTVYQAGAVVYRPVGTPNGTVYRVEADPPTPTPRAWTLVRLRRGTRFVLFLPLERNGTATVEGETMARFDADAPGLFGCGTGARGVEDLESVAAFRATAYVDGGILRRFDCTFAGPLANGTRLLGRVTWSIREVGTAAVRPPASLENDTAGEGARSSRGVP